MRKHTKKRMILQNRRKGQYCPGSPIVPKIAKAKAQDSFECLLIIVLDIYLWVSYGNECDAFIN